MYIMIWIICNVAVDLWNQIEDSIQTVEFREVFNHKTKILDLNGVKFMNELMNLLFLMRLGSVRISV